MPHYEMVSSGNSDGDATLFNKKVNELLAQGYELYGPPSVIYVSVAPDSIVFSQALLKP